VEPMPGSHESKPSFRERAMEHSSIGNHDPCLMLAVYGVLMGWVVVVPVPKHSDAETVSMTLSFP
jgi:hypothetical protein